MVSKKILIAANTDYRFDQRLQRISSSLRAGGYHVDLLGRQFGNSPVHYHHAVHLPLWFRAGKLAYLELNLRFLFFLLTRKADAICSVDLDTLPACWLAAGLKGCLLIQDSHEYMAEVPEVAFRPLTRKIWHMTARLLLPGCDLRYTVSSSLVREFRQKYRQDFYLIRNMAEFRTEIPDVPVIAGIPENDFLVFLGAVNQGRGLEEILEVLAERTEQLVIIGEGDLSSEVRNLVSSYGLQSRVFFTGRLLPDEAASVLRRARAGLNLLRDEGLSYLYSLANKFFDYVHAGIPQLCVDFHEYRSLMEEFRVGILTDLKKEDLHNALNLLSNADLRSQMSAEAEKARQVWNWQKESAELIRLYEDLFSRMNNAESVGK